MIRKSAVAGAFYPADPKELEKIIDEFLKQVPATKINPNAIKGLICPHAGYIYSAPIAAYSYQALKTFVKTNPQKSKKPLNIFILGPAHYVYTKASVGNFSAFETPLGKIKVNQKICEELLKHTEFEFNPEAHLPEHSIEVQLPFLQKTLENFEIIPILLGNANPQNLSEILSPYFTKNDSIFIISSDLSHYEPYEIAQEIDKNSLGKIIALDTENEHEIDACGNTGIKIIIRLAKKNSCEIKLLNYRNSGDTAGNKSGVVGYGALAITKL